MKRLIFLVLLFISIKTFSQTDYYQYNPKTGTSEKIGYSTPSNGGHNFSPYIPQNPVQAEVQVGVYLQQKYNNNLRNIQSAIDDTYDLIISILKYDTSYAMKASDNLDNYIDRIRKLDFSKDDIYESIISTLSSYRTHLEADKESLMDNYYKNKNQ